MFPLKRQNRLDRQVMFQLKRRDPSDVEQDLQCKGLLDLVPEIRYLEMSDHLSEDGICCRALGRCNARTLLA